MSHFWKHNPKPCGITCEYCSDINDFYKIKEEFKKDKKAVLFVEFTNMKSSGEMVKTFENLMNIFAPEVIAVPWMWVGPVQICQEEPENIYKELLKVSKEYMKRMKEA